MLMSIEQILNIFYLKPYSVTFLFACFLLRLVGIEKSIPIFGSTIKNSVFRNGITLSLSVIFFPVALFYTDLPEIDSFQFLPIIIFGAKEFFIGYAIGYVLSIPFAITQSAGSIIDTVKGSSSVTQGASISKEGGSALGSFLTNVMIVHLVCKPDLFIEILGAIVNTYKVIPCGIQSVHIENFQNIEPAFLASVGGIVNDCIITSVRLACPALAISLTSDLSFSLINRLTPQVQFTFLSVPVKSISSWLVLYVAFYAFFDVIDDQIYVFSGVLSDILYNIF